MLRLLVLVPIIVVGLLTASCAGADKPTLAATRVTQQLMCQCGTCEEVLSECDCPTAVETTTSIEKKLAQGQSEERIIQSFVVQYGEKVLSANSRG
jgi:cytochrome c-type biogenesis protein CcmH/NrfF